MPPDAADVHTLAVEMANLIGDRFALKLSEVEKALATKTDEARAEIMREVQIIKAEQSKATVAIVRIETRLDEGDKRFTKLEERVAAIEERERKTVSGLLKLFAAAGLGAVGSWWAIKTAGK